MNIKSLITTAPKAIKRTVVKRSPELMLALGIGTAFAAVITGIAATPKALKRINEVKIEKLETEGNDISTENYEMICLQPKETAKAVWKYYIPTAVLFVSSMACLICSHHVSSRRTAALAAAMSVTETAFRQYKDAVVENVAPEVKEKIESAVAAKQIQRATDPRDTQIYISDKDGVTCYDPWSGRYFKSSKEQVKSIVNDLNHEMLCDGFGGSVSLNDFYDKIGLPDTDAGSALGWNTSNGLIEIIFDAQLAPDGTPCLVVKFDKPPIYNFDRY